MGFHPRPPMSYEGPYWQKYLVMDASPMGEALTEARKSLVENYWDGPVVDIGIGGGRFVESMGDKGIGFDVNSEAVEWLVERGSFFDPYSSDVDAITCWDSLEHIPEPEALINQVNKFVFVSLPIFNDPEKVTSSKHYRPGEHIWYWSDSGLIKWFDSLGFELVERNNVETQLGREEIWTYVFRRYRENIR